MTRFRPLEVKSTSTSATTAGIDGYVTLRLRVDADDPRLKCGIHDLPVIAYVTPDGRGTLNDNASVIYDMGRPPC